MKRMDLKCRYLKIMDLIEYLIRYEFKIHELEMGAEMSVFTMRNQRKGENRIFKFEGKIDIIL